MASNFFLVHHTFKPGMAEKWWANMKNYDEAKQKLIRKIRLKQVREYRTYDSLRGLDDAREPTSTRLSI